MGKGAPEFVWKKGIGLYVNAHTMLITLIGAGNVATHLGRTLKASGHKIHQVYSRSVDAAETLADLLEAEPVTAPEAVTDGADLYVCALKDDALETVLNALKLVNPFIIHTSGSLPLSVL